MHTKGTIFTGCKYYKIQTKIFPSTICIDCKIESINFFNLISQFPFLIYMVNIEENKIIKLLWSNVNLTNKKQFNDLVIPLLQDRFQFGLVCLRRVICLQNRRQMHACHIVRRSDNKKYFQFLFQINILDDMKYCSLAHFC